MTKKILVVDDQIGIRLLLKDILANEGYIVEEATTGKEALDKIRSEKYDVVILDYKLPIMDGSQVLDTLENENIEIKAIVMSGLIENISEDLHKNKNVKKLMAKPFNVSEVIDVVAQIATSS